MFFSYSENKNITITDFYGGHQLKLRNPNYIKILGYNFFFS